MSTDREATRVIRSWLKDDGQESADHILGSVLDQLDSTPQRRASGLVRRYITVNGYLKLAAAALLLTAVAFGAYAFTSRSSVGVAPQATAEPTPAPASLRDAPRFEVPAGRYVTGAPFEQRVVFTLPEGWSKNEEVRGHVGVLKPGEDGTNAALVSFVVVTDVYEDPCAGSLAASPPGNAEELVAALRAQPGFEIGPLTERTIGGRPSWTWDVTPTVDVATCADDPWLYQIRYPGAAGVPTPGGTIAGAHQRITVVDVGETLFFAEVGTFEPTTKADAAEANAIVDSMSFE